MVDFSNGNLCGASIELNNVLSKLVDAKTEIESKMDDPASTAAAAFQASQNEINALISKLQTVISNARLIDDSNIDNSKVYILSKVKIKNISNGMEIDYTLVAENEADLKAKKISVESPIGKGLLGKSEGDIADIVTPGGIMKFEIIEISR